MNSGKRTANAISAEERIIATIDARQRKGGRNTN